jgi:hypothetical protein
VRRGLLDAALELGDAAVADLGGGSRSVSRSTSACGSSSSSLSERIASIASFSCSQWASSGDLDVEVGELLVERVEALLRRLVGLLLERDLLDLELRMRRSTTSISVGSESISMRSFDAASSIRSIALSGRNRPVM